MAAVLKPAGLDHLEDDRNRDLAAEVADGLGAGRWRPAEAPGAWRRFVSGIVGVVFSVIVVGMFQWLIGVALAVAMLGALAFSVRHLARMMLERIDEEGEAEFRRLDYERDIVMSPAWGKELRVLGFGEWIINRWYRRLTYVLALDIRKMGRLGPGVIGATVSLVAVISVAFVWASVQISSGALSIGAAAVLAQAVLRPLADVESIGQAHFDLTEASRPLKALTLLESRIEERYVAPILTTPRAATQVAKDAPSTSVAFRGVHFRYPNSDRALLSGVDLDIPVGTSLAIVGLNGAGKTTLIKLLCRFCEPSQGAVLADGIDIATMDASEWQGRIGAIFQDYAQFPMSAIDNIRVGNLAASRERALAAAGRAGIDRAIAELPHGWETMLAREFSNGAQLSGGQWQRVALSRALLAAESGARILVLDEPAANLDVRAEAELNKGFLTMTKGLTTVLVSHRFSTVRQVDRICVLEDGHITETGCHEELMELDGRYAEMFRLQAMRYAL
ncbi:ATP-binding cassette domain-containing protein [Actinopolymorpha alba]|uniref:ATP-binding cassette domain-containing protein n=1 Tax=Actinopolymorpha alba TaxID=533267 RepID=UPI0012F65D6E|nr:ATP-binding cassette domain-containing protein [Actinopolymorpha alba]